MVVKVLILAALIRLLLATENPFLCSGIYAAVGLVFALITGATFVAAIIGAAISLVFATIYFWLLNRFELRTGLFWAIAALGIFLGLV